MHQNLQKCLCKSFQGHHVRRASRPISSFFHEISSTTSNQCTPDPPSVPKPMEFNTPILKVHPYLSSTCVSLPTQFSIRQEFRKFSGNCSAKFDPNEEIDEINLKFAEAREEIDMALESKETVYFNEEAETARAAVKAVLEMYEALLSKLPEGERGALQRSMGLKIEQLKAELAQLND